MEKYYNYQDAKAFVETCASRHITIFGIERFDVEKNKKIPDMDAIADFSDASFEESISSSRNFFKHFHDGLFTFSTEENL